MNRHDRKMREILYEEQGRRCNGSCEDYGRGIGISLPIRLMHCDHIDHNGPDGIENRQALCSHCNSVKGDRGMEYLLNYLRLKWERMQLPLFNGNRIAKRRQPVVVRKQQPRPQGRSCLPLVPPLVLR